MQVNSKLKATVEKQKLLFLGKGIKKALSNFPQTTRASQPRKQTNQSINNSSYLKSDNTVTNCKVSTTANNSKLDIKKSSTVRNATVSGVKKLSIQMASSPSVRNSLTRKDTQFSIKESIIKKSTEKKLSIDFKRNNTSARITNSKLINSSLNQSQTMKSRGQQLISSVISNNNRTQKANNSTIIQRQSTKQTQADKVYQIIGNAKKLNSSMQTLKLNSSMDHKNQDQRKTNRERPQTAAVTPSIQKQVVPIQEVINEEYEEKWPITAAQVLKYYQKKLSDYEQSEIFSYDQIYFIGPKAIKIRGSFSNGFNYGYDDERGDYKIVVKDHIAFRFEVLETLGKGSFGQVIKCFDHKNKQLVALKIIRNKKRFHQQAAIEVKILEFMKQKDEKNQNFCIQIRENLSFRRHLCILFDLYSINLYDFLKINKFQGISLGLIRRFGVQILQALKFLKQYKIIHCDLKPENILLKQANKSGIQVIDFGSSCFEKERIYTYIQSRFYRSPEIILGLPYSTPIDM